MSNKKLKEVIRNILLDGVKLELIGKKNNDDIIDISFLISSVQNECEGATVEDIRKVLDELYNYDIISPMSKCKLIYFYRLMNDMCVVSVPIKYMHEVVYERLFNKILDK